MSTAKGFSRLLRLRMPLPFFVILLVASASVQVFAARSATPAQQHTTGHTDHSHWNRQAGERIGTADNPVEGDATDFYVFRNLPEMVATSDIVIEATVTELRAGARYEEVPGELEGSIDFSKASLRIDSIHYARADVSLTQGDHILLSQIVGAAGKSIVINNVEHSQVGDEGFYFITLLGGDVTGSEASLVYNLISSQGRYLKQPDNTLRGSNPDDPLVQSLQALSPEALRAQIAEAKAGINDGKVQPQSPLIPCPEDGCVDTTPAVVGSGTYSWDATWVGPFECSAEAVNAVAITTRVDKCWIEDRTYGHFVSASAVEQSGNIAVTFASATSAGEPYFDDNTWLCWEVSATFEDSSVNTDEDCQQVR